MSTMPGETPPQAVASRRHIADRVLSAAADECIISGIQHTTIAAIARQAGLPEEEIHHRWASLEELLTAVVVRDLHTHLDAIDGATRFCECSDDHIVQAFACVVWFLDNHPLVGGAIRSDADIIRPTAGVSVAPIVSAAVALIVDRITATALQQRAQEVDAEVLTEVMTRLIQSLLLTRGTATPLTTRRDVARYARRCVVPLVHSLTTPTV